MLTTYQSLSQLALHDFADIVIQAFLVGGTALSPNKLRLKI